MESRSAGKGPAVVAVRDLEQFSAEQFVNLNLFDGEAFFGRLLCFLRGQQVPVHVHAYKDECFDVIAGEGTLLVGAQQVRARPGMMLYVPAGVTHGLRADGTDRWVVRETVSERIYARRALYLLWRALWKRLRPSAGYRIINHNPSDRARSVVARKASGEDEPHGTQRAA